MDQVDSIVPLATCLEGSTEIICSHYLDITGSPIFTPFCPLCIIFKTNLRCFTPVYDVWPGFSLSYKRVYILDIIKLWFPDCSHKIYAFFVLHILKNISGHNGYGF